MPALAEPTKSRTAQLKRWLRLPLGLLTLAFLIWAGRELALQWDDSEPVTIRWGLAAAALLPSVGVTLFQAWGWVLLIRRMSGVVVPWGSGSELFLASQLGRYLPAKLGMPVILAAGGERYGIGPVLMVSSMLLIVGVYTAAGGVVAFSMFALAGGQLEGELARIMNQSALPLLIVFALGTATLTLVDRRRYPRFALRVLSVEGGDGPLLPASVVACYLMVWLLWLAHGALLTLAVGGTTGQAIAAAPYFVLAPIIGFLALVAPGGVGVREAVISGGLLAAVGPAAGIIAALLSRMYSLGVDALTWLVARALRGELERPPTSPDDSREHAREARP